MASCLAHSDSSILVGGTLDPAGQPPAPYLCSLQGQAVTWVGDLSPLRIGATTSLVTSGSILFVSGEAIAPSSGQENLFVARFDGGRRTWLRTFGGAEAVRIGQMVLVEGLILMGDRSSGEIVLYCIDPADGQERWRRALPGRQPVALCASGERCSLVTRHPSERQTLLVSWIDPGTGQDVAPKRAVFSPSNLMPNIDLAVASEGEITLIACSFAPKGSRSNRSWSAYLLEVAPGRQPGSWIHVSDGLVVRVLLSDGRRRVYGGWANRDSRLRATWKVDHQETPLRLPFRFSSVSCAAISRSGVVSLGGRGGETPLGVNH